MNNLDQIFYDTFINNFVEQVKNAIKTKNVNRFTKRKGSFTAPVNNTGNLINSIRIYSTEEEIKVWCAGYVLTLIYGRQPGTMPPVDKIDSWLQSKGINANAFAVAKSMQEFGSSIWQANHGSDSGLFSEVDLTEPIENLKRMIALTQLTKINSELIQSLKEI